MSSSTQSDSCDWLLVEWKTGGRDVVYIRSVVSPLNEELKAGDVMMVNRRGDPETATLVARARERGMLDSAVKASEREEEAGPSMEHVEEAEDFSSSASSWAPSHDSALSGDSAKVKNKKVEMERCKRQYSSKRSSEKVHTRSHNATPIIPKSMQQSKIKTMMNGKRAHNDSLDLSKNIPNKKSLPDFTRMNNRRMKIEVRQLINIKNVLQTLFNVLEGLKRERASTSNQSSKEHVPKSLEAPQQSVEEDVSEEYEEHSENDELNRSDDTVLITNKCVAVKTARKKGAENVKWVPIGSGNTVIPMDKFKKVNWKSYTVATRTLLVAVFPRRILATHSLTGKKSPAFQDKPAKMYLDPKVISDVIMEIMNRFKVKENLVRSIITIKCADERKMWKTRINKKTKNNESMP